MAALLLFSGAAESHGSPDYRPSIEGGALARHSRIRIHELLWCAVPLVAVWAVRHCRLVFAIFLVHYSKHIRCLMYLFLLVYKVPALSRRKKVVHEQLSVMRRIHHSLNIHGPISSLDQSLLGRQTKASL